MGQQVIGVIYGAMLPKEANLWGEDGLYDKWEADHPNNEAIEFVMDSDLVGAWVVCEHGKDKGVPNLGVEPMRLGEIVATKKAKASWDKFAKWLKKQGVEPPSPELWIAPTEVA